MKRGELTEPVVFFCRRKLCWRLPIRSISVPPDTGSWQRSTRTVRSSSSGTSSESSTCLLGRESVTVGSPAARSLISHDAPLSPLSSMKSVTSGAVTEWESLSDIETKIETKSIKHQTLKQKSRKCQLLAASRTVSLSKTTPLMTGREAAAGQEVVSDHQCKIYEAVWAGQEVVLGDRQSKIHMIFCFWK